MNIPKILVDEYPVNDDELSINIYVRDGEGVATLAVADRHSSYDPEAEGNEDDDPTNAVDGYLNEDDLYELAMSAGRALAALGSKGQLAMLIRDMAETLAASL